VPETIHESDPPIRGAAPEGAEDVASASRAVREMFSSIAPHYDLLNHLLSANVDKLWWKRTARAFAPILSRAEARVLDVCCGTGDMAFALQKQAEAASITGADFSHPMLRLAVAKSVAGRRLSWVESDALSLPFADETFDLVTSAFGFRNLADYDAGLREIFRVLKPGGQYGILEFSDPPGWKGRFYNLYFRSILPRVGRLISGSRAAYSYLPASVARFPSPEEMMARMRQTGFSDVSWKPYTFGIAGLYRGTR
jgi:demethylmenaquinone methyltransferase/2-methoxy-6-polyprenyl-1,4-benzoquinol methylase